MSIHRYSRIFLRAKGSGNMSSSPGESSKLSSVEPITSSTYSYPPSTSALSHDTEIRQAPHPYTMGPIHSVSSIPDTERDIPTPRRNLNTSEFSTEKPAEDHHTTIRHTLPPEPQKPSPPSLPHLHPLLLLLLILPIPPLLSLTYMPLGHAILRPTHPSFSHASLRLSVEAGATGGIILAVPLALLLYLLLYPSSTSPSTTAPEDFFDDDNSSIHAQARWTRYAGYAACVLFAVCMGGVAGPLGVTCLSTSSSEDGRMLSTGAAAEAGLVGGVVLVGAVVAVLALGGVLWSVVSTWRNSNEALS